MIGYGRMTCSRVRRHLRAHGEPVQWQRDVPGAQGLPLGSLGYRISQGADSYPRKANAARMARLRKMTWPSLSAVASVGSSLNLGYEKSLLLSPFDHRQPYVSDMFHLKRAVDETQLPQVTDSHQLKHCQRSQRRFKFDLLVPPTGDHLARAGGNKDVFDRQAHPPSRQKTLQVLQDAGIEPDVWKIEGLDLHADSERTVKIARRGGRGLVGCIVLGRGADEARVRAFEKGQHPRAAFYRRAAEFFLPAGDPQRKPKRGKLVQLTRGHHGVTSNGQHRVPYADGPIHEFSPVDRPPRQPQRRRGVVRRLRQLPQTAFILLRLAARCRPQRRGFRGSRPDRCALRHRPWHFK